MKGLFETWGFTPWFIIVGVALVATAVAFVVNELRDRRS